MSKFTPSRTNVQSTFSIGDRTTGSYISLTGSTKFGDTSDDTHQFTGSIYIDGSLTSSGGISAGSITLTGSTKFGDTSDDTHQFTGSVYIDGDLTSSGDISAGSITLTGSTKFGDASGDTHQFTGSVYIDGGLILSGGVSAGSVNTSGSVLDNQIARFDGTTGNAIQSSSIQIKDNGEMEWENSGSAEALGTDPDGGSAIGAVIGSSVSLVTAGAKIVSEQNNNVEKAYTDKDGQRTFCISPNGGATNEYYFHEIISINSSSGNLYSSANLFPAGCLSYGVSCRVLTSFATASQFFLGISSSAGGFATKWGSYIDGTAGVTNLTSSMESGYIYHTGASTVYVSSSVLQSALVTSGAIRIEGRYRTIDAPIS